MPIICPPNSTQKKRKKNNGQTKGNNPVIQAIGVRTQKTSFAYPIILSTKGAALNLWPECTWVAL